MLDLVPQSAVKVDDVTVGSVEKIELNGWTARVHLRLRRTREAAGQRHRRAASRPACSARSTSRCAAPGRRRAGRPARRRRRHPAVPHRPQPRGRGGPRRDVAAAQRWRRRPAEDHRDRAEQGAERQRGRQSATCSASSTRSSAASTSRRPRSSGRIDSIDQLAGQARRAAARTSPTALDDLPGGLKVLADQRQQLTAHAHRRSADLGAVGTRVIHASQGRHRRQPRGAAADPDPAERGRRRPAAARCSCC